MDGWKWVDGLWNDEDDGLMGMDGVYVVVVGGGWMDDGCFVVWWYVGMVWWYGMDDR